VEFEKITGNEQGLLLRATCSALLRRALTNQRHARPRQNAFRRA
jgi:hypothetical protein